MQAGPAAATRARSALGDISNKGASARNGVQAGKVSSRARPTPRRATRAQKAELRLPPRTGHHPLAPRARVPAPHAPA